MNYKQILGTLAFLLVLLVVVGAWASRTPQGAPSADVHALAGIKTADGDYEYVENKEYYTVTATYPADTGLAAAADAKARLAIEQAIAARIGEFKQNSGLENLTAEDATFLGLGEDRKYALAFEYKKFNAQDFVSYLYTVYEDTGGAHPNTYFTSFVFDKNGEKVPLAQLFPNNPNWLEELSLLVSNDVVSQYKARTQVDDTTGLLFNEGLSPKVENFSNFVIDGDELVIFLPPYQVAAYAAGSFEVRIPLKEIQ